jgi:AraC family transcriptional regulator of adaptative response/methylated-DNA-[protein]-cysteine methyltransferase
MAEARSPGSAITTTLIATPIGPMVAAAADSGICLLEYSDEARLAAQLVAVRRRYGPHIAPGDHILLHQLREELARYFAGTLHRFTMPLHISGTPFQERVWGAVAQIPYGETRSYAAIAAAIGAPRAARAVGHANGRNRLAILIPCHRLVGADGALTGYGGGIAIKRALLELERR